jgi:acyl transferase domain-containing protein/acyl carrier protein
MSDFLERISKLSPKRLALLAAELNSNLERLRLQASEPLAIIGIGCRFPGGANDPESLWQLISEGRDAISEVPPDRWDINAYFDPDPDAPGKMSTRWGGFLSQIDQFDPEFFGISPREAAGMDPQQRLLLEVAWEAFEHADQSPDRLAGSRTGVFVGLCNSDYYMMRHEGGADSLDAYVATGNAHSVASGRISYLLGLQGPSVSVDTACSSSLVAVHLACQALRLGECRMALAGGVNMILTPDTTVILSKSHMMSPVGRCKAFDASADGFVRAEGCGLIVVKRLLDAREDGDRVLAVIRGTALNQDGKSSGLTAPNGPSQVAVIQESLANAGLQPSDVDFIEAHGTGTSLGDPIEARALADVFGSGRAPQHPLCVGSIKSNIGHAESAAGIAGLLKVVLSLQHGRIPPSLHMKKLNPHIDWGGLPISVPIVETSWSRGKGLRIAGVSSFGFSGTNAHVIVSDAPITEPGLQTPIQEAPDPDVRLPLNLLPLSARSEAALAELARKYEEAFAARPGLDLAAVCHTAGSGRSHFEHRLAVLAADLAEAKEHLAAFQRAETSKHIRTGCFSSSSLPSVVFMFAGQGSQHPGMGRELFKTQPVFRRELEKCAEILKPLLDTPLLELLFGDPDSKTRLLDQTQYTQPALFALEYALAGMWRSWGLEPAAVLGHSVGEYVAACVADVFSLEDGLRLIAERGRLMATLPPGGAMAAVFAEESRVAKAIAADRRNVTIACINAPASMVISGNRVDVDAVLAGMKKEGVESRPLAVSHAFHSPLMHAILEPFERVAKTIRFSEPRIAIVSNTTGKMAPPDLMTSAGYWSGHIRNPVRFADSIRTLRDSGQSVFLEIGPHRVLTGLACATAPEREVVWAASMSREEGNWESLLEAASTLYIRGVNFDWTALPTGKVREPVTLPTYPFQRRRFWLEGPKTARRRNAARLRTSGEPQHPFLGDRLDSPAIRGAVFEIQMGLDRPAFLNDHRIFGRLIMPSPAYIEMALAGAAELFQIGRSGTLPCEIAELAIREPLFLPEKDFCRIQLVLDEPAESTARFQVCSYEPSGAKNGMEGQWRTHATGQVRFRVSAERARTEAWNRDEISTRCSQEIDARAFYDSLIALGLDFGERFRGIASIRRRDGEALAEIRLPQALTKETSPYRIHPALLDSCLHLLGAALPADAPQNAYLLIALERFRLYRFPPERFWNHTVVHRGTSSGWEVFTGDIWLYTDDGETIAEIKGLQLKRATGAAMARRSESEIEDWFYRIDWLEQGADSKTNEDATSVAAAFIPAPVTLADKVGFELRALAKSENLAIYQESVPKLERLSFAFIMQALSRMGWVPRLGEEFATRELADRLGVVPIHRRLFARLMAILAEEGILNRAGDQWIVLKEIKPINTDLAVQAANLAREFPDCSAEVMLTARCAQSLDAVIRGQSDPLQLLFPNGDFETADALYRRSPFARALNSAVRHVLVAALQDAPQDRKVRILEIGAGTGGTTSFLLPHLSADRTRYAFTDVSPLFLARARDEFQTYPFVEFDILDIEKAPATQGFSGRTFDVVIAANALHATRDLRETVRNAVSLLAPGGLLILLEGTTPTRWVDLTFGLTDGWWRFGDTALRSDYALVSRKRWLSLLEEAGLECIGFGASEDGTDAGNQQTIFLGRKALLNDVKVIPTSRGYWIVLADSEGISRELGMLIEASGQEWVLVQHGTDYKFTDGKLCLLNLLSADQFARLLSDASAGRSGPLYGIVNLWAVDEELTESTTPAQWEAAQARLGAGVLHAFQAFLGSKSDGASAGARFWIATRGAQAVSPDSTPIFACQPMQALVWGLSRVISLEHPSRFGAVIDLDPGASPKESADAVWRELRASGEEDAVSCRHGRRLVPRVVRTQGPSSGLLAPHRDASYLVTGGLGGLGLHIAHWLAERGAGHLMLLSRRNFPERSAWSRLSSESEHHATAQSILEMERLGARVIVAQGDVADEKAMRSLIAGFGRESPPLRGIVHAAVEMSSSLISELDLESFNRMCRTKALGGWILHQLTLESKLDFFVLFSSTTALWGVAGLGHYAAANQALDQLAQWRHGHGLPALSVNWGTWREMRVASKADQHRFEQAGLHPMPVERSLAALERLIASSQPSAIVASVDWNVLRTVYEMRRPRPLFAQLSSQTRTESGISLKSKSGAVESNVSRELRHASPARRRDILIAHLRLQAGSVLGFDSSRQIELDQGLFDMGMDSLMSVELKGRLERSLGVPLPSTLTFNYPTIGKLADFLLNEVLRECSAPTLEEIAPTPASVVSPARPTEDLSEEDLSLLLMKKLEQMK